ncbi:MAG: hypothetical protein AAGF67_12160 [Verrucomicrobiota bacterium]
MLISLGIWKREGIMHRINHARADAHLTNAQEAGENGDWKTSERLSLAAWQLKEGDSDILRQLFLSARELKSRHLLIAAGALFDHPESKGEDRLSVLSLHLSMGDYVKLQELLPRLTESELDNPDAMHIGIRFYLARKDGERALALTRKLLETRTNPGDQLLAAEVYASVPTQGQRSQIESQEIIRELFLEGADTTVGLAAFALLSQIDPAIWRHDLLKEVKSRIRVLEASEMVIPVPVKLLATEVAMRLDPSQTELLFETTIQGFQDSHPIELGDWLLRKNRSDLVFSYLTEENAKRSASGSRLYLDALFAVEAWEKASRFLSQPHPGIPPMVVMALRAVTADQLNRGANSRSLWERAFDHASLSSGRSSLIELARIASRYEEKTIRNRALTEALKRPSSINLAMEDVSFLFSYLFEADESGNLLAISRNLLRSEPTNPVLLNNVAWLNLVSGGSASSSTLSLLVEKHPEIYALRSTLALSLLAEGSEKEALTAVTPLLDLELKSLSPAARAVIALVHHRGGDSEIASEARTSIPWDELLTVERRFFTEALTHSTAMVEDR